MDFLHQFILPVSTLLTLMPNTNSRTAEGNGTTSSAWAAAYIKAKAFVAQLNLEEKVNLTVGYTGVCVGNSGSIPRLGFPGLCFEDAPSGIRGADFVSAFPAGSHLGQTWDKQYMYDYGKAMGDGKLTAQNLTYYYNSSDHTYRVLRQRRECRLRPSRRTSWSSHKGRKRMGGTRHGSVHYRYPDGATSTRDSGCRSDCMFEGMSQSKGL